MSGSGAEAGDLRTAGPAEARGAKAVYLDQALWKRLADSRDRQAFADSWLTLQCRMIAGVRKALVALGPADVGPFSPFAHWPQPFKDEALSKAAELAMSERRGIVQRLGGEASFATPALACRVAFPFLIEDRLHGVIAVELDGAAGPEIRAVMRQLQWGAAWIRFMLSEDRNAEERAALERTKSALGGIATALSEERFRASCNAVVTELALKLQCERVCVGFIRNGHAAVASLSHSANFGKRMNLIRLLGHAMDEAIDQRASLVFPPPAGNDLVVRAHEALAKEGGAANVLTIPLALEDRLIGAIAFEREGGKAFDQATIDVLDCVAAAVGPVLFEKRKNDRWIVFKIWESVVEQTKRICGPGYLGRKLALATALLLGLFLTFARDDYRVTADGAIEGLVRRTVSAPFDGFILEAPVRAGDRVKAQQLIAALDDKDLVLERLRWVTERQQKRLEYERALASGKRADTNILRAQIDEAEARIRIIDSQLSRSKLRAPFDGLVVSGDLSQRIGATVKRGDQLFEVTPLTDYRVILKVDERQIADVKVEQRGQIVFTALPEESFVFHVEKVTPVAVSEEGRNLFQVEARLIGPSARLSPGMKGVGKVGVEPRRLIWIWTRSLADWARIAIWRWFS